MTLDLLSTQRQYLMGFSTLYIMLFHITTLNPNTGISFFDMGNVGVDVFLILSGIGIYFSLSKDNQTLKTFYKSRLNRIVPPYLLITIPFSLYSYIKGDISINHIVFRLLGLSTLYEGNKWLWYITIALFTYLLAPLFKKVVDHNKPIVTFLLFFTVFYSIAIFIPRSEIMWTRIPMFYLGMIIGKMLFNKENLRINPIMGFISLILVFCIAYKLYHHGCFGHHHYTIIRFALNIYSLPLSLCVAHIINHLPTDAKRILGWFGKYSFELYITHLVVIFYFFHNVENLWLYGFFVLAISLPSSYILKIISNRLAL